MTTRPCRIAVFISASSVKREFAELSASREDDFFCADEVLEEAVPVGRHFEAQGVEVVIARRGTSHLLRENLTIPVLSLPQSSLSIIHLVRQAGESIRKLGHEIPRIFMPNFRHRIEGLEIINELLPLEFSQRVYHDAGSMAQLVAQAAAEGFHGVVGGAATRRFAAAHNLFYQELVSTRDEILETVDSACSVALANRREKVARLRYQTVNDLVEEGVVSMDAARRVLTVNQSARRILQLKKREVTGVAADTLFDEGIFRRVVARNSTVYERIEKLDDQLYLFNQEPVSYGDHTAGFVTTFRAVSAVQKTERRLRQKMSRGFVARYRADDIFHQSGVMTKLIENIKEIARTRSTVLVIGETGTGKELVAQSIHSSSARRRQPFVTLNCGALPESLLESELFGYEEGAFTGSKKGGKAGMFELAHEGTLFLDEIDSTPQTVQIRLLRVLQEKEVMRIGGDHTIPIDVRIITASGSNLWEAVQKGAFRRDLFFRLNVLQVNVPPLRERREDIPFLFDRFLAEHAEVNGLAVPVLQAEHLARLRRYSWPGNVRQLRNFAEQLVLSTGFGNPAETISRRFAELEAIVERIEEAEEVEREPSPAAESDIAVVSAPADERGEILQALQKCRYNRAETAQELGMSRTTLWRKIKRYQLG